MTTNLPPKPAQLTIEEEGDIVVLRCKGAFDFDAALHMHARRIQVSKRYGYHLLLFDAHNTTIVMANTRKFVMEGRKQLSAPTATAILGASFAAKTLTRMMLRAGKLLTKEPILVEFFDTEPEARAYLAEQREVLARMAEARR